MERKKEIELRKYKCPKGHCFFASYWKNYLTCPVFCNESADAVDDILFRIKKEKYNESLRKKRRCRNGCSYYIGSLKCLNCGRIREKPWLE